MARRHKKVDEDNLDRWLVSYADFITLLFAFFVVMYAISSVNEGKYRVLSDTMIAAFNKTPKSKEPIQIGEPTSAVVPQEKEQLAKPVIPIKKAPPPDTDIHMKRIAEDVKKALRPLIDNKLIKVKQDKLWVEVEMNTSILFDTGSAVLEDDAIPALRALADVLKSLPNYIQVEGHTDNVPIKTPNFPTNWELSASRAASVVRLLSKAGVDPKRLTVVGHGEYQPIASNDSYQGRRQNRRVVVIILADKNAKRITQLDTQKKVAP